MKLEFKLKSTICFVAKMVCLFLLVTNEVQADPDFSAGPYLSFAHLPQSSIVISWIEDSEDSRDVTLVLNGNPAGFTGSQALYLRDGFYAHHAEFVGLSPNTEYEYEVSGLGYSQSFLTGKEELETGDCFIIYGDTRSSKEQEPPPRYDHETFHPEVANAIITHASGEPLFLLHVGDLSVNPTLWDLNFDFFDPLITMDSTYDQPRVVPNSFNNHVIDTRPVLSCLGNHDVWGSSTMNTNIYEKTFEFPKNNSDSAELFYSFDYGNIHFTILNTEVWKYCYTDITPEQRYEQTKWLEKDLANSEEQNYRLIAYHYPHELEGYNYSGVSTSSMFYADSVENIWCPIFESYKVQAVFNGHHHHYYYPSENPINGVHYVVTGGGGAPLNTMTGAVADYHYVRVEYLANGNLNVESLDTDNSSLHDFDIEPVSQPNYLSGNITENIPKGAYYVTGNITIPEETEVTIEAGARLIFKGYYSINVYGTLIVEGNSRDLVKFLGKPGDTWQTIRFYSTSSDNSFDWCYISDCDFGIYAVSTDITLSNCYLSDVEYGILVNQADISITDSKIDCELYGLKETGYSPNNSITITRCSIKGNESDDIGVEVNGGSLTVSGHHPDCDYTIKDFAVGLYCDNLSELTVEEYDDQQQDPLRCVITENDAFGVKFFNCDNAQICESDITGNGYEESSSLCGGLYLYNSSTTFTENYITQNYGCPLYAECTSDPIFGAYGVETAGNEFDDNSPSSGYTAATILECGDSYPVFNDRYNNIYINDYGYYICNFDMDDDIPRDIEYNYWGSEQGPSINQFYPSDEGLWDWNPWCIAPNEIGGDPDFIEDEGDGLEQGLRLEADNRYEEAVETYRSFIVETENMIRKKVAMRRILSVSVVGGLELPPLIDYYQSIVATSRSTNIIEDAERLMIKVREAMGDYEDAIRDYERILTSAPSFEDSIYTVIDAGRAYLLMQARGGARRGFNPQIPQLEPTNWDEFKAHRSELLAELQLRISRHLQSGKGAGGSALLSLPNRFFLHQNQPNPFNPLTQIRYDLPELSDVRLDIFNIAGRKVITLVNGWEQAGCKSVVWNGLDDEGKAVSSGVYLYKITITGQNSGTKFSQSAKMILLK